MKKTHLASKCFIEKPYVVRLTHEQYDYMAFRKIVKRTRDFCVDTWGYSFPEMEQLVSTEDSAPLQIFANGVFSVNHSHTFVYRSYWIFKDEQDALSFRLIANEKSFHSHMWPSKVTFTIEEFLPDNT